MKAELQEMQMQPNGMMEGTADQEAGAAAITPHQDQVQLEGEDVILPTNEIYLQEYYTSGGGRMKVSWQVFVFVIPFIYV